MRCSLCAVLESAAITVNFVGRQARSDFGVIEPLILYGPSDLRGYVCERGLLKMPSLFACAAAVIAKFVRANRGLLRIK
jgi:hypothetical protein